MNPLPVKMLDKRIEIQEVIRVRATGKKTGGVESQYRPMFRIFASVLPPKEATRFIQDEGRVGTEFDYIVTIRHRPLPKEFRILYNGDILNPQGDPVDPDGTKRQLVINTTRVASKGNSNGNHNDDGGGRQADPDKATPNGGTPGGNEISKGGSQGS